MQRAMTKGIHRAIEIPALVLAVGLAAAPAAAENERQDLEAIRDAAVEHVLRSFDQSNAQVVARAGELDARLRLQPCVQPLRTHAATARTGNGNASIRVECPGTWRIFVPVRVETPEPVVVLARTVARGHKLSPGDLETRRLDTRRLAQGYFTDTGRVAGQVMRRSVSAGSVITPAVLQPAVVVQRGQTVRLVIEQPGISIAAAGTALADAARGDRLRVRNTSSGKVVEGTVGADGIVRVR